MSIIDTESHLYKSLSRDDKDFIHTVVGCLSRVANAREVITRFLFRYSPYLKKRFDWGVLTAEEQVRICVEYIMVGIFLGVFSRADVQTVIDAIEEGRGIQKQHVTMTLGGAL